MAEWAAFRADAHLTLSMCPNLSPEASLPDFHRSMTLAVIIKIQTMTKLSCFYFSTNHHTQIEVALIHLDLLDPSHVL